MSAEHILAGRHAYGWRRNPRLAATRFLLLAIAETRRALGAKDLALRAVLLDEARTCYRMAHEANAFWLGRRPDAVS